MRLSTIVALQCVVKRLYSTNRPYSSLGLVAQAETSLYSEDHAKSYSEIPGPKELPLIGNSWRFAPIIGKFSNSNNTFYLQIAKGAYYVPFFLIFTVLIWHQNN